jgi:UDPglucose 6-dehydrogenase
MKSLAKEIFQPFNWQKNRIIFMSVESSELTKYAANAFLATKISFMNEIALICEEVDANIHEIRSGIGSDKRIGPAFLYAGLGYGGSCFPKDVNSLIFSQKKFGLDSRILTAAKNVNDDQYKFFIEKIKKFFPRNRGEIELALWGLSFKPGTDDIRESLSIKILKRLSPQFKKISVYDPLSIPNAKNELSDFHNIVYCSSKYGCISSKTQALIICTEWKEFWMLDNKELKNIKAVFDGRNILSQSDFSPLNIRYFGIGNPLKK